MEIMENDNFIDDSIIEYDEIIDNNEFDEEFYNDFDSEFDTQDSSTTSSDIDEPNDFDSGEDRLDLLYHFNTNKHKQEGKHRLKEDTIFKGKANSTDEDEYDFDDNNDYNDLITFFDYESEEVSNSEEKNNLIKDIYTVLSTKTDIDFKTNRRKPNKETFNLYYNLLIKELGVRYTNSEMFVELSFYFTNNIFNTFKLLSKESATIIIKELTKKGYLKNLSNINFL